MSQMIHESLNDNGHQVFFRDKHPSLRQSISEYMVIKNYLLESEKKKKSHQNWLALSV